MGLLLFYVLYRVGVLTQPEAAVTVAGLTGALIAAEVCPVCLELAAGVAIEASGALDSGEGVVVRGWPAR
jgi:hypothetical protein